MLVEPTGSNGSESVENPSPLDGPPPGFLLASRIKRKRVRWLMRQRVPLAEATTLAGEGGSGKSTAAQRVGADVTRGDLSRIPGGSELAEPRGVVILTTEEDPEAVIFPRLAAMDADLERVLIVSDSGEDEAPPLTLPSGADRLMEAARSVDAALIVIDTGPSFLDRGLNSNSTEDVRQFFRPLVRIARELRLSVLVICHLNKKETSARGRVSGNSAWIDVPRSALIMAPPPGEDPLETPERVLALIKANLIAGKMPPALGLRLVSVPFDETVADVLWTGELQGISGADLAAQISADERSDRADCMEAIYELLTNGPLPASDCEAALKKRGFSARTIRRARSALFVTRESGCVYQAEFHGPFVWRLPEDVRARDDFGDGRLA